MCGPILPVLAIAATVGSAVYSAKAQSAAAKSQAQVMTLQGANNKAISDYNATATENAATYNADVANKNAKVYDNMAADSISRGVDGASDQRLDATRSNARGRAVMGSSGTTADAGTNLDLQIQNKAYGEMNALAVMNNAEREAYGYKTEAVNQRNTAKGIMYDASLDAGGQRAAGDVGMINAQAGAASTIYGGKLASTGTLINGAASTISMTNKLYPDLFAPKSK